ncbi:uncharacterized protein [Palaemon carinicauda]|uniref:uncharacterized protein isoform X1 n=1 Tax=Palaemon carinicauda TaxID=392227 RepID=UPI0035B5B5B3
MILKWVVMMLMMMVISLFLKLPMECSAAQILQANSANPLLADIRNRKSKYDESRRQNNEIVKKDDNLDDPDSFTEQRKLISIPLFESFGENITGTTTSGGSSSQNSNVGKTNPLHSLTLALTMAVPLFAWFFFIPLSIGYRYLFEFILGDEEFLAVFGGDGGVGPLYLVEDAFHGIFF